MKKILVANEPINTPKLQNAWKTDIMDFCSRVSIFEACKLMHISNKPKHNPNKKAKIINVCKSLIKGTGSHNNH